MRKYKQNVIIVLTLLFLLWWLLTGCRSKSVFVPVHSVSTVTEWVRDTVVEVRLVPYRDSVSVRDTVSRLENVYAYSSAVWSGGRLSHSLAVKDTAVGGKTVVHEIVRTDTVSVPYPVDRVIEKNVLKGWQKVLMWVGATTILIIIMLLIKKCL